MLSYSDQLNKKFNNYDISGKKIKPTPTCIDLTQYPAREVAREEIIEIKKVSLPIKSVSPEKNSGKLTQDL